jgi:hypothetical protein
VAQRVQFLARAPNRHARDARRPRAPRRAATESARPRAALRVAHRRTRGRAARRRRVDLLAVHARARPRSRVATSRRWSSLRGFGG